MNDETKYDRETALRLAAEAREDDERMTRTPFEYDAMAGKIMASVGTNQHLPIMVCVMYAHAHLANGGGMARTRNNLRATADQLAAAVARIDELENEKLMLTAELAHERGQIEGMTLAVDYLKREGAKLEQKLQQADGERKVALTAAVRRDER